MYTRFVFELLLPQRQYRQTVTATMIATRISVSTIPETPTVLLSVVDGTNTATGGNLHLNADNSALSGAWSIQDYANIVVNDANGLGTGDISLDTTTSLDPNVDISNMGNLTLDGIITLDQNLTAATATVNGVSLWKGSYDYADLTNLGLGAHFTNDGGTLTVLRPFATVVRFR
jgi:hypothetical protein